TVEYHELGHLLETLNPNILRIEKSFVEARTKGEPEVRLRELFPGWGYSLHEVTKKDDFISPYIGKTYEDATEVLSMGLESLYVKGNTQATRIVNGRIERKAITDDEEYLNLIIGLIVKG